MAAAARDWEARWTAQNQGAPARADRILAAKAFQGGHLRLYETLAKAEGAVLCQAWTEKIGLRAFLFKRGVPGITTPVCPCGQGPQTAAHLFVSCTDVRSEKMRALGYNTEKDVYHGLSHVDTAPSMARALTQSGWLPQFRVFNQLWRQDNSASDKEYAWARRPPASEKSPGSIAYVPPSPPAPAPQPSVAQVVYGATSRVFEPLICIIS